MITSRDFIGLDFGAVLRQETAKENRFMQDVVERAEAGAMANVPLDVETRLAGVYGNPLDRISGIKQLNAAQFE